MKLHQHGAALLALFSLPMLACAQASVTFSSLGEIPTLLTGPVATQGSRHIGTAALDADFFGSANLSDGVLRASVSATPNVVYLANPVAQSDAQFRDTLKVVGPGTGLIPIQFRMDFHALMTVDPTMGLRALDSLFFSAALTVESPFTSEVEFLRIKRTDFDGTVLQDSIECFGYPCILNQPLTLAGVVDGQVLLNYVTRPGVNFPFLAKLSATTYSTPGTSGLVDASQTARLSYTLPAGYTLTSQSGVFLSAVPEPATWALWAGGLLAVAALRARVQARARRDDDHA
jgi:hypothetical protein